MEGNGRLSGRVADLEFVGDMERPRGERMPGFDSAKAHRAGNKVRRSGNRQRLCREKGGGWKVGWAEEGLTGLHMRFPSEQRRGWKIR